MSEWPLIRHLVVGLGVRLSETDYKRPRRLKTKPVRMLDKTVGSNPLQEQSKKPTMAESAHQYVSRASAPTSCSQHALQELTSWQAQLTKHQMHAHACMQCLHQTHTHTRTHSVETIPIMFEYSVGDSRGPPLLGLLRKTKHQPKLGTVLSSLSGTPEAI